MTANQHQLIQRPTPHVVQPEPQLLRRLSSIEGDGKVLSIYLDLDPSEFATGTARVTGINSVLHQALDQIEALGSSERKDLQEDVEEVRAFLSTERDWAVGARAVAIFYSSARDLFDLVKLQDPVPTAAFVEDTPYIRPLADVLDDDTWCVALVNRRTARIFLGSRAGLEELDPIEDDVHGRHEQGGWSQARFERSVEDDVEEHLKHTCERLLELYKAKRFEQLLVGATEELWPRITAKLHTYIASHLVARIDVDTQKHVSIAELQAPLARAEEEEERKAEQALVERLCTEIATGGRAAAGLERVLACLNEARVDTMVVEEAYDAPGVVCSKCGWLGTGGDECPLDGSPLDRTESIVEKAAEKAAQTSARFIVVEQDTDLAALGNIAALLRF